MTKEIIIKKTGGPDVMEWSENNIKPRPNEGEIRIRHTAIGVNYIDTYHRDGTYPVVVPCVLGIEAVGKIVAVGTGVKDFSLNERVGYASGPIGAYSEERDYPVKNAVRIPDFVDDVEAAAVLLKGMTVEYLFTRTYGIHKNEYILFHAAAGGVGLLACQWSKTIGAKMIGTVSTAEKAELAKNAGCDFIINYTKEEVSKKVMEITNGNGVSVAYDGVGKDTFQITIDSLKDRGTFVSFGQSSGMIKDVSLHKSFAPKNLFYTRPSLLVYNKKREDLIKSSEMVFDFLKDKKIKVSEIKKYKLKDAARAHEELQSRKTHGSLVLIP